MFTERYKNTTAISLCLASIFSLSACSMDRPTWLGGEDKRPAENVRIGAKRIPILNPKPGMMPPPSVEQAPAPHAQPPMVLAPLPPPVAPAPPLKPMPEDLDQAAGINEAPSTPDDDIARREFPVDSVHSLETVETAPIPAGPESTTKLQPAPGAEPAIIIPSEMALEPAPIVVTTSQSKNPEAPPVTKEKKSWFDRMIGKLNEENEPEEEEALNDMPYPLLSTVPEKPPEFTDMKAQKDQAMQDLMADHALAQEQKDLLAAEPSQTTSTPKPALPTAETQPIPPATPASSSISSPQLPPLSTITQKPQEGAAAPKTVAPPPATAQEPELLGHAYDPNADKKPENSASQEKAPAAGEKKGKLRVLVEDPYSY
jgi:hypothetical protein